jgi:tetratricopeptide (TPR) repeat protein
MLAEMQDLEEAELRYTQAITLDKSHSDAWIGLAMCHGVRGDVQASASCLEKAQGRRPDDPRIGLLLAYALKAAAPSKRPTLAAVMPKADVAENQADVEALSALIEAEPDFVEAVLSLDADEAGSEVLALLANTLGAVLERNPEHADLHYHCGCVLARLGRTGEAIAAMEQAIDRRPQYVKALIQLAKLYGASDRNLDARRRLEEAIRAGAEYADVYYLMGNLCREGGLRERALDAYREALRINPNYKAAREALEAAQV